MPFERFKVLDKNDVVIDQVEAPSREVDTRDVAIIGIATQILGGVEQEDLWRISASGQSMAQDLPEQRREDIEGFFRSLGSRPPVFAKMAYLEDIAAFDHNFFGISPREAMLLDPLQRLFLQNAWQVIEDAGYGGRGIVGSNTGIYLGLERQRFNYGDILTFTGKVGEEGLPGSIASVIASRIAHILDLKGPTMIVDTACSSSLVALHLACKALETGDCDQAIVGGVSFMCLPPSRDAHSAIMTSSGTTRSFDDSSDGTSAGEGVISLFIKRACDAVRSHDHIYALIKGTAINSDGRSIGITAPNADAQADVVEQAWKKANVLPETIGYIEAHGTGTKIGDPVEIEGLKKAFERYTTRKQFCCLSTIKANLGHLGGAAGLAGVLNATLSLNHRTLPPLANFRRPNRLLGLTDSPFYINLQATPWPKEQFPRRCGVSSFGMSGTNAHAVLQEAPSVETTGQGLESEGRPRLFVLSAKTKEQLDSLLQRYVDFFRATPKIRLSDVCFTCASGRSHHAARLATVAGTMEELTEKLASAVGAEPSGVADVRIDHFSIVSPDREAAKDHEITASQVEQLNQRAAALQKSDLSAPHILDDLGRLYVSGAQIAFDHLFADEHPHRVPLPCYPFEKKRCWPDFAPATEDASRGGISSIFSPLLKTQQTSEAVLSGRVDGSYTELEKLVANAWSAALGYRELDIYASYFELGGDSLFAVKIVNHINKKLDLDLKVTDLLSKITIHDLALHIGTLQKDTKKTSLHGIPIVPPQDEYAVSFAEHRYYILWRLAKQSTAYNIPFAITVDGPLDLDRVHRVFVALLERHDSLRTCYDLSGEQVVKRVPARVGLDFEVVDDDSSTSESFARAHIRPFDLSTPPLVRVSLRRVSDTKHDLVVDMHHIISDGVSHEVLFEEFVLLYNEQPLPETSIRYIDFSNWQRKNFQNRVYENSESFWLGLLKSPIPILDFPGDRTRPDRRTFAGDVYGFCLPKELVVALKSLSARRNATLFMTLYAAYFALLSRYTGQNDIIVGTISTGREHEAVARTIGAFANFLPVRLRADLKTRFGDLLEMCRQTLLDVFEHQNYPFDRLIDRLDIQHAANRNPVYDTMLVLQNQQNKSDTDLVVGDLRFAPLSSRQKYSTLDFKLDAFPRADESLECQMEYSTELYDSLSMERFCRDFCSLLGQVIADPERPICDYPLMLSHNRTLSRDAAKAADDSIVANSPESAMNSISVCSSFTANPLDPFLTHWLRRQGIDCSISHAPYHQVFQELLEKKSEFHRRGSIGVILFRLDDYVRDVDGPDVEKAALIRQAALQLEHTLLSLVFERPTFLCFLPGAKTDRAGPLTTVANEMYDSLLAAASSHENLFGIDMRDMASDFSIESPYDPYSDRQAHIPYSEQMFAALAFQMSRNLSALNRSAFKVIALDCDNTLWGGVVGEDGKNGIEIGPDHLALQRFALQKKQQGFLLVLCSKNNEQDVFEVFDSRPEMLLKREDLVGWRINWLTKSENLESLAEELSLGLSSFIFIDDSLAEIAEVMNGCPEVFSLKLPSYRGSFLPFLSRCWAFDKLDVTEEDSSRTAMYKQESQRKHLREGHMSLSSFLEDLKLEVCVDEAKEGEFKRLSQLSQRTNQFNTTTVRMSEADVAVYAGVDGQGIWSIRARDKFGTYGIVGALYYRLAEGTLSVDGLMMSCRALGRGVEFAVLACLKAYCRELRAQKIIIRFARSPKNTAAARFLTDVNLAPRDVTPDDLEIGSELSLESSVDEIDCSRSTHIDLRFREGARSSDPIDPARAVDNPRDLVAGCPITCASRGESWTYPLNNKKSLWHLPLYEALFLRNADELFEAFRTRDSSTAKESPRQMVLPRSEQEGELIDIWKRLLENDDIGVTDDFFSAGGDSIKAVAFISLVRESFGKEIELADFFAAPTVAHFSRLLSLSPLTGSRSIPSQEKRETYPVSSAQHRLFMLQHMERNTTSYNLPFFFSLKGPLDRSSLESAIRRTVDRHEILRTGFEFDREKPVMRVLDELDFEIGYDEAESGNVNSELTGFVKPFDLSCPPLFRVKLLKTGENEHVLAFDLHHIITDGRSIDLLLSELLGFYCGNIPTDEPLQYRDFSTWQQARLTSGELAKSEAFWSQTLADELPVLSFPTDFPRPPVQSFAGDVVDFELGAHLRDKILCLTRENGCSLFMFLLACFNIALSKFTRQKDMVIGTTVSGRTEPTLRNALGLFIETLAIRCDWKEAKTFTELLGLIKRASFSAFENQDYPFKELVSRYADEHNLSRNPMFDVMLILQNFERAGATFQDITVSPYPIMGSHQSKLDITLEAMETKGGISFEIEYCTALFSEETMGRLAETFLGIIEQVCDNPKIVLDDIVSELPENSLAAIAPFNATALEVDMHDHIAHRFGDAVRRYPSKVACVFNDESLTYEQLDHLSSKLARRLSKEGVKRGCLVALRIPRSLAIPVAVLAVMKLEAAYLPIDVKLPRKRVDMMIEDAKPACIVSLDSRFEFEIEKSGAIHESYQMDSLAYVVYTSGTTGRPKGVIVCRDNLTSYVAAFEREFELDSNDTTMMQASFSFDWFAEEFFPTIVAGATFAIVPEELTRDPAGLSEFIKRHRITVVSAPPVLLGELSKRDMGKSPRLFITGGDTLLAEQVSRLVEKGAVVYNTYGPTESTVCATYYRVSRAVDPIPIGRPISNVRCHVLDSRLRPLPVGVPGELCIAGSGVTAGYLNRPEETHSQFVKVPFETKPIYRTGDLARWLSDGNLAFFGRIDEQVSIRGYRVEPKEIEAAILAMQEVESAVVVPRPSRDRCEHLVAYFTAPRDIQPGELRERLLFDLPEYMIPTHFVQLGQLPMTVHQKVDFKALPEPSMQPLEPRDIIPPSGHGEMVLVDLLSEVLGAQSISMSDNFFALGGDSMKAMILASRIEKELGVRVSIVDFFQSPNILSLAEAIGRSRKIDYVSIPKAPAAESYPLSFAQRRLFVLNALRGVGTAYNIPVFFEIRGVMDVKNLAGAFDAIVKRHQILRTRFATQGDEPRQFVSDAPASFSIEQLTLEGRDIDKVLGDFVRPFNLDSTPLFRVGLLELEPGRYILAADIHHIVADGVSLVQIIKEATALYSGKKLEPLSIQFVDYAVWEGEQQSKYQQGEGLDYWKRKFEGELPVLNLPYDHLRPASFDFEGSSLTFSIEENLTLNIREFCTERRCTLFQALMAAYAITLSKVSGQQDFIVGTPSAGRVHADLEQLVGMFVTTLPLRLRPLFDLTFEQFVERVGEELLESTAHQQVGVETIIEEVVTERDTSRNPLFDVMFVLQNNEAQAGPLQSSAAVGFAIEPYFPRHRTAKYDLTLEVFDFGARLQVILEFATSLFDRATIERFASYFTEVLRSGTSNPSLPIADIAILSDLERQRVLEEFNRFSPSFKSHTLLPQRFEELVVAHPDLVAVSFGQETMTYRELNKRSNELAHYLRDVLGVRPGDVVGISVERSFQMIVAIFGVMKSGAGYLAVDPTYPRDRVAHILADSEVEHLLIDRMNDDLYGDFKGNFFSVTEDWDEAAKCSSENPVPVNSPDDVLYVIYTSGTTGMPNGAMLSHDILNNLITWMVDHTSIETASRCLQFTSINFCVSFQEIVGTLVSGGEVCLIDELKRQDINYLMSFIGEKQIENLYLPFSYMNFLFNESSHWDDFEHQLKNIITAGEQLKITDSIRNFLRRNGEVELHNHYGSSEMHVVTSYTLNAECVDEHPIPPAGRPISNTQIYILDENLQPVPIGVFGEIHVASRRDILGYINAKDLNEEKLIRAKHICAQKRLYRSGDLGRWLPDGNIELKGRKDTQIKLRGFRIELSEIETKLLAVDGVKDCVVEIKNNEKNEQILTAYLVIENTTPERVRSEIGHYLPHYMIPQIVPLDGFPLMPNGKVDRGALPFPSLIEKGDRIGPRDAVEQGLAAIWAELLDADPGSIGIDDNFFYIGGHSLRATKMLSMVALRLEANISLNDIFNAPDLRSLAEIVRNANRAKVLPLDKVSPEPYYALPISQRSLLKNTVLEEIEGLNNITIVVELSGEMDSARLQRAIDGVVSRHVSLRMFFEIVEGEAVARVTDSVHCELVEWQTDESHLPVLIAEHNTGFDLGKPPLFRAFLASMDDRRHVLALVFDHLVFDGVSGRIFVDELLALYDGTQLGPVTDDYLEYAKWHNKLLETDLLEAQKTYWQSMFLRPLPAIQINPDHPVSNLITREGARESLPIRGSLAKGLQEIARTYDCTLYIVLIAALKVFVSRLTGLGDIAISSPLAARRMHPAFERMIGMFASTVTVRSQIDEKQSFGTFLREVRERTLEAFSNQDFPPELLLERYGVSGVSSIFFAYQNFEQTFRHSESFTARRLPMEVPFKTGGLAVDAFEIGDGIDFSIIYTKELFERSTVRELLDDFNVLISLITEDQHIEIGELTAASNGAFVSTRSRKASKLAGQLETAPTLAIPNTLDLERLSNEAILVREEAPLEIQSSLLVSHLQPDNETLELERHRFEGYHRSTYGRGLELLHSESFYYHHGALKRVTVSGQNSLYRVEIIDANGGLQSIEAAGPSIVPVEAIELTVLAVAREKLASVSLTLLEDGKTLPAHLKRGTPRDGCDRYQLTILEGTEVHEREFTVSFEGSIIESKRPYSKSLYEERAGEHPKRTTAFNRASIPSPRADELQKLFESKKYGAQESIVVLKDDDIILEYSNSNPLSALRPIHSLTKSIASLLIGIAIDKGAISGIEANYYGLLRPREFPKIQKRLEKLTLRHVLSMQAGFERAGSNSPGFQIARDPVGQMLEVPMDTEPGSVFFYNNNLIATLSEVLEKATGLKADLFAARYLFGPLAIENVLWTYHPRGFPMLNGGLSMSPLDLLKIGKLIIDMGCWEGKQVVSSEWIEESTKCQVEIPYDPEYGLTKYGFLWWLSTGSEKLKGADLKIGRGWAGQLLIIDTLSRLVAVTGADNRDSRESKELAAIDFLRDSGLLTR